MIDGRPTGLVRVSLGWMSTWEDAAAFVGFVRKHFVNETPPLQVSFCERLSAAAVRSMVRLAVMAVVAVLIGMDWLW